MDLSDSVSEKKTAVLEPVNFESYVPFGVADAAVRSVD